MRGGRTRCGDGCEGSAGAARRVSPRRAGVRARRGRRGDPLRRDRPEDGQGRAPRQRSCTRRAAARREARTANAGVGAVAQDRYARSRCSGSTRSSGRRQRRARSSLGGRVSANRLFEKLSDGQRAGEPETGKRPTGRARPESRRTSPGAQVAPLRCWRGGQGDTPPPVHAARVDNRPLRDENGVSGSCKRVRPPPTKGCR